MLYIHQNAVIVSTNILAPFRIHKPDIKVNKDLCGTARLSKNVCHQPTNFQSYLQFQLVEQIFCNNVDKNIKNILHEHEKYWQSQLFTIAYGMNNISDLYDRKKKCCRGKQYFQALLNNFKQLTHVYIFTSLANYLSKHINLSFYKCFYKV